MNRQLLRKIGRVSVLLFAAACGAQSPQVAPTSTPVLVPTPPSGGSWNYAVLGDSSSWGFPKFYAESIEADLGVKVNILNWAAGDMTSADVLAQLRNTKQERLDVSRAEVVTFYGNPLHIIGMRIVGDGDQYNCSPQAVAAYKSELKAIADEIFSLRKGQPSIIRTYTRFMPFYRLWRAQDRFQEYQRCVAALDAAILEVGKELGILVADTGLALNGPDHDQDPNDKGYLTDGIHENSEGAKIVALVFRELGYAAIVP